MKEVMKKIFLYSSLLALIFTTGCIKNKEKIFTGKEVVEFDATVLNSPTLGVTFPLMTRVPIYGVAASTAHPSVTRASGNIKYRVNLVGRQSTSSQVITFRVVTSAFSTTLDIPTGTGSRLPATVGTHFNTTGTLTIPANSSFGEVEISIINSGSSSTTARYLVLELDGNSTFGPSENFKRLGILISQI